MARRRKYFWGWDIKPKLPFLTTIASVFQGWRNTVIVEEMCFLHCSKCDNVFAILKSECQKELDCPRCNIVADYIWEKEEFLVGLLKRLLDSDEYSVP